MSESARGPSRIAPMPPHEEKQWSYVAYLGSLVVGLIAPAAIYLIFRERSAFLRSHAANALNIQIAGVLTALGLTFLWFVALLGTFWYDGAGRPWPVLLVMFLFWALALSLIGTMAFGAWKVSKGEYWVAPKLPRFMK